MSKMLSGPHRETASGHVPTSLVVFLHGVGANGEDLIDLADSLATVLPDAAFVAPNAPDPCDMGGMYQWFSLQDRRPAPLLAGVQAAAPILTEFLLSELKARNLPISRLALVGFSQGAMMALHVAPRLPAAPAAVVGFSGRLMAPELLESEARSRPPALLVHGEADPVVPFESLDLGARGLRAAGLPVETLARPGLGHGIDGPGLFAAARFLLRHLNTGLPANS